MRKLSILASILLLLPAVSQAKTLEELLVEKGVITKGEASSSMGGAARVYYNGGTRLEFPDSGFTARIGTILRTRYTFTDNDSDSGRDNTSSFDVNNARLILSGTALHNEFEYKFQTDMVKDKDASGAKDPALLDAYLTWKPCDWGWVRMGQFKTMISRQYNTSAAKLQFANRSKVSDFFDFGRQAGLAGGYMTDDNRFSLSGAVYNGESTGEGFNKSGMDTKHTGAIGARLNLMGDIDPYSEGDVEWTEDMGASIGAAYLFSQAETGVGDVDTQTFNADVTFKSKGFSLAGEFYNSTMDPDGGSKVEPVGFYVQAGYFLKPKTIEVAARYGYLDCDNSACSSYSSGAVDSQNEVSATLNYYWWKHQLKAQLGYELISDDAAVAGAADTNTNLWMLQLSSWF